MEISDRRKAQMHTLEGIAAAFIIIAAAFYATQSIAITPTSSSTASKQAQAELQVVGNDVLTQAKSNGNLKEALLDWEETQNQFDGAIARNYQGNPPPNDFGDTLNGTFDRRGIAYNIELYYSAPNSTDVTSSTSTTYLENGEPTDNAVVASETVILRDDDELQGGSGPKLENKATYPIDGYVAPEEYRDTYYNMVEVRMTLWRK